MDTYKSVYTSDINPNAISFISTINKVVSYIASMFLYIHLILIYKSDINPYAIPFFIMR